MKTTFPEDHRRIGNRLPRRERSGAERRATERALIDVIPADVRIAIVAEAAVIVAAAYNYSPLLALVLYALTGASLVVSVIGE